ncbi:hypothetical protein TNIN_332151, partial [Trichonephila inaurata madagascariensis]
MTGEEKDISRVFSCPGRELQDVAAPGGGAEHDSAAVIPPRRRLLPY